MKTLSSCILIFVAALALIGCSQPHPNITEYPDIKNFSYQRKGDMDLVAVSYAIANQLEINLKAPISPDDTVIVASFVDVNNLNASSTFGRIMAEQVGSRLAQKGYKVIEMKLRQNSIFVEEGKGEFLLSRDLKNISLNHNAAAVVVGTYACSRDKIYISTRFVNPSNSVILSSFDYGMPASLNMQKYLTAN
jgi:TolB-like protein